MRPDDERGLVLRIVRLAWPVLIGQWAVMGYGVVDTVMTGHAGAADLAALGIGSAIYFSVLFGLMGVVLALNPIIAQHFGAGRDEAIGVSFVQGIWVALFAAAVGAVALTFPDIWLRFSGVAPPLRVQVGHYLQAMVFTLPAVLLFRAVYALNTALSRPKAVMLINLIGLALKIPLNYALIFGHWYAPALGSTGCAVSAIIVSYVTCVLGFVLLQRDSYDARFLIRFAWPRWQPIREILRIGVPTGLSYVVEVTSFTFMALMVARLGTDTTAAHQITANLAATFYSMPFAFSVAIATLVGQSVGAGKALQARHLVVVGLRLALSAALCLGLAILHWRDALVALYSSDPAVAAVATRLLFLLAFNHVADTVQSVLGFSLRAYKHAIAPMVIYTVSLWGLGLGGGYWLAFHGAFGWAPQGAQGLWLAATVSLAVAAVALFVYLMRVARDEIRRQDQAPRDAALRAAPA